MAGVAELVKVMSGVLNQADMGSQVNDWLFGSLMIFILALTYGMGNASWAVNSVINALGPIADNLRLGDDESGISLLELLGNKTSSLPVPTPLTPIPSDLSGSHGAIYASTAPGWLLVIGIFVWAAAVLIGLFDVFGQTGSNRLREWKQEGMFWWIIVPLSIVVFFLSPAIVQILGKTLFDPIASQLINGVAESLDADPLTTLADPLWLLLALFGVAGPDGINQDAITFNGVMALLTAPPQFLSLKGVGKIFEIVPYLIRRLLSPSIILEITLLLGFLLVILQSVLAMLYVNFLPFTALTVVAKPFSPRALYSWLIGAFKSMGVLLVVVAYDCTIGFVGGNPSSPVFLKFVPIPLAIINGLITYAVVIALWIFWTRPLITRLHEQAMNMVASIHHSGDTLESGGTMIGNQVSSAGALFNMASNLPLVPNVISNRFSQIGQELTNNGSDISDWSRIQSGRLKSIQLPWSTSNHRDPGMDTINDTGTRGDKLGRVSEFRGGGLALSSFPLSGEHLPVTSGQTPKSALGEALVSSGIHYAPPSGSSPATELNLKTKSGSDAGELSTLFNARNIPHELNDFGGEHWVNFKGLTPEESDRAQRLILDNQEFFRQRVMDLDPLQKETMRFDATSKGAADSIRSYLNHQGVKANQSGSTLTFSNTDLPIVTEMIHKVNNGQILLVEKREGRFFVRKNNIPVEISIDQLKKGQYLIVA